ncbi:hypothetical protein [Cupriavidus basilensis]|uniref:hypothetical protein n=1 Tax=Cupriavidus basilensis TaxID=68895 RepID=UPI001147243E|nr:hypothetical protein [Cupriavidus basilensis]
MEPWQGPQGRPSSLMDQRFGMPRIATVWGVARQKFRGLKNRQRAETVARLPLPFSLRSFSFSLILKGKKKKKQRRERTGTKAVMWQKTEKPWHFGGKPWDAFR